MVVSLAAERRRGPRLLSRLAQKVMGGTRPCGRRKRLRSGQGGLARARARRLGLKISRDATAWGAASQIAHIVRPTCGLSGAPARRRRRQWRDGSRTLETRRHVDDEPAGEPEVRSRRRPCSRRWEASGAAAASETVALPFNNGERPLVAYPGKRPLIVLTSRPPQLETPFSVFDEGDLHAKRRVLRPLSLGRHPAEDRSGRVSPDRSGQGGHPFVAVARGAAKRFRAGRTGRGQSMLGQQPRFFRAASRRRPARQWRDGQCAVERRVAESALDQGWGPGRRRSGLFPRARQAGPAGDAGIRQGA